MEFKLDVLAAVLSIAPKELLDPLTILYEHGIVQPIVDRRQQNRYRFVDPNVRAAAYSRLPKSVRNRCHAGVAHAMQEHRGRQLNPPAWYSAIADHLMQAGRHIEATQWWKKAAEAAVLAGNSKLAIPLLLNARESISEAPGNSEDIDYLLGTQIAAVKGNGSPDVLEIYRTRADDGQTQMSNPSKSGFDAKWGLMSYHLTHGDIPVAIGLGHDLLAIAQGGDSDTELVLAHRMIGLTELLAGHIDCARFHLSRTIQYYAPDRHAELRFRYASDQLALAYAHRAWAHAASGDIQATEADADAAIVQAERHHHPHTLAHVTGVLGMVFEIIDERPRAIAMTMAAGSLADQLDYSYWKAWAAIVLAAIQSAREPASALADLEAASTRYEATGACQALPYAYARMGHAALQLQNPAIAESKICQGIAWSRRMGVRLCLPDLQQQLALTAFSRNRHQDGMKLLRQSLRSSRRTHAGLFEQRARELLNQHATAAEHCEQQTI